MFASALSEAGLPPALRPVAGPVLLQPRPASTDRGVALLPMVASGPAVTPKNASSINAALRREDGRVLNAAAECRASFREQGGRGAQSAWRRSVSIGMAGPRFLAFDLTDNYFCGGAYPNDGQTSLVFDLATGKPVNWLTFFPPGARGRQNTAGDGATLGLVAWPELTRRAAAQAQPECREALSDAEYSGFSITLDARNAALVATPAEFPHVIQACAEPIRLHTEELRRLRFSPVLIGALVTARRLQR
jgi:hypothetical protein